MGLNLEKLSVVLGKLEQEQGLRVIHVAECDSRAWGFNTPDSDYDLRIIYVKLPWHQTPLDKTTETVRLNFNIDGLPVDVQGFELKCLIRKIMQSGFGMYEVIHSPIQLAVHSEYLPLFVSAFEKYGDPRHMINHCRGLAYKNFELAKVFDAKSMLHALRCLLIAERFHDEKEPILLQLPALLEASTLAPYAQEILSARNAKQFVQLPQVTTYMRRKCDGGLDKPERQKLQLHHVWYKDLEIIYQHIVKQVCEQYSTMSVDLLDWKN